jgi:hypothetical protein
MSTPTSRFRFRKQAPSSNFNIWGGLLNSDVIDLIDEAIGGINTIAVAGNVTLTSVNYATDQARPHIQRFTGAGGFNVTIPAVSRAYIIDNQCAAAVVLTTGSGATASIAAGARTFVFCDGTNVYQVSPGASPVGATLIAQATQALMRSTGLGISDGDDSTNRLILNGDGAIDQPNAGAAVAWTGATIFSSDGSALVGAGAGRFNVVSAPSTVLFSGNSLARSSRKITVTTAAAAPGATDFYSIQHRIEGTRWRRLGYGLAGADPCVLRIIGFANAAFTLTGSFLNNGANRAYPFSSAVAANTLVDIQIPIPGDVTGTWLSDTGVGLYLSLTFGCGATFGGTPGAWVGANLRGVAGAGLMAAINNTFEYVVDIIPGTVAPPLYIPPDPALELVRCMREYEASYAAFGIVATAANQDGFFRKDYLVPKRIAPVVSRTSSNFANCADFSFSTTTHGFTQTIRSNAAGQFSCTYNTAADARL